MKQNEGTIDRVIRLIIGVVLIIGGFFTSIEIGSIILWVVGGMLVFTAFTGFCGAYMLLGIDTTGKNKKENEIKEE